MNDENRIKDKLLDVRQRPVSAPQGDEMSD